MRIGFGYDIHRLVPGRRLIIGGVQIPHRKGLLGHSDADVLTHALADALLGALANADIGEYFPDTDPKYKNISSIKLLEKVLILLKNKKAKICNVDAVIITRDPKMSPYREKIRKNLSQALKVSLDDVSVKAKTNNRIGEEGNGKAIACYVIVLLK